jgi:hypothetical protein
MADEAATLEAPLEVPAESTDLGDALESPAEPEETGTESEGEPDQAESEADSEGEDEEAPAEPVSPDGRKMPDSLKKALAAVKATSPEAAKELRGLYFANQEYRNAFPTVQDAIQAKTLVEEIGGPEGVQQIASEREEWNTLDKQYADGSNDFIKSIAEANPEAFVKIAPHAINEWASRAPEQYQYFAQSLTVNMLKNAGIPDQLAQAYHAAAENPQLQAQIAGVYNSIVDMHEKSQQFATKQKSVDPEREKLTQEKQQFEMQRRASFEEGIAKQAETYLTDKMKPEVERILAGRKIDPEAEGTIKALVTQEVQKRLAEIPGIEAKLEAFYRTGDAQKSIEFIKAQYNRLLPEATKKVVAPLYRNIGTPAQPNKPAARTGATPAVRAEVTLREMPEWKDIDFNKCTTADVVSGWAILKSGKKASGWA